MSTKLWTKKGYGLWLALPPIRDSGGNVTVERCLVILDPGANTGMSVTSDKLDKDGLRDHPDTIQEKMTVIGSTAPSGVRNRIASIIRKFNTGAERDDGIVMEDRPLGPGQSMLTVESNGNGKFHIVKSADLQQPWLVRFEKWAGTPNYRAETRPLLESA